jgi:hypothetical protein
MVKPQLVKRLKEQLEAYVVKGKFEVVQNDSGQEFVTLQHLYQIAGGDNVELRGIKFVKTEYETAIVGLTLQHKVYRVPMLLELKMREREGYWQVAEFNNLPDYMKNLDELEAKHGSGSR